MHGCTFVNLTVGRSAAPVGPSRGSRHAAGAERLHETLDRLMVDLEAAPAACSGGRACDLLPRMGRTGRPDLPPGNAVVTTGEAGRIRYGDTFVVALTSPLAAQGCGLMR